MKRFLSVLLIAALCFGLSIPLAAAEQAQYSSTQQFLDYLDVIGINYRYWGVTDGGDEEVTVGMSNDDFSYRLTYFFSEDLTLASIRVWNLIDYDRTNEPAITALCNQFNYDYRYATFYTDSTDDSVTARSDVIFRSDGVGEVVWGTTTHIMNIIDKIYPQLAPYSLSGSSTAPSVPAGSSDSGSSSGSSSGGSGDIDPLTVLTGKQTVLMVQQVLNLLGYDCGTPDGVMGKNTSAAISRFQADRGLTQTGTITYETYMVLYGMVESLN